MTQDDPVAAPPVTVTGTEAILASLEGLASHGLDPAAYGLAAIETLEPGSPARADAIRQAWMLAATHLRHGALDPTTRTLRQAPDLSLTATLDSLGPQSNEAAYRAALDALAPRLPAYETLRRELAAQQATLASAADAETAATEMATGVLLRRQEYRVLSALQTTGTYTAHDVTNEWDDSTNATPYSDVNTGKETVEAAVGQEPNTLIVDWADKPRELRRTSTGFVGKAAAGATRIPAGHPEGYLEAFAILYRNFAQALADRLDGREVRETDYDYPTVRDGVRGMAFLDAVVKSSRAKQRWTKVVA